MNQALVIGGSDGIGRALTHRLLGEDWTVRVLSRSPYPETHEQCTSEISDVTDPAYPERLGSLPELPDLVVYAAGIGEELDTPGAKTSLAGQSRTFAVNLTGAVVTLEALLPRMLERGSGHVLVLSSLADLLASPEAPAYAASKAGLTSYVEGIDRWTRPQGVALTNVRFGFVDTKMAKAPWRPCMLPVERAVDHLMACLRDRPRRLSRPRRLALAVEILGLSQRIPGL